VTSLRDRAARKLANQRKELEATYDRERLRQLGDIVMANLHRITRGQIRLTAEDFYDPDMKEIEITLSPTLSPQQNAAKFYKDYTRAKNAEKYLTEQIAKGETELDYLSSVLDTLNRAESDRDLAEIRQELVSGGYLREVGGKKKMKLPPSKPMEFRSSEGFLIHVGRNNRQNDQLTLKTAQKNDIWLHTQKIHGSHVIIECEGRQPGDQTVTEAATLAAYYSQAREGQNVPVDYTPVKFVKKPAGAKPGMVIYTTYSTAFVTPDAKLAEQLRLK
jgi:predicted ribosome quality control (RQC) complex YloA/Tae2 family protein